MNYSILFINYLRSETKLYIILFGIIYLIERGMCCFFRRVKFLDVLFQCDSCGLLLYKRIAIKINNKK